MSTGVSPEHVVLVDVVGVRLLPAWMVRRYKQTVEVLMQIDNWRNEKVGFYQTCNCYAAKNM